MTQTLQHSIHLASEQQQLDFAGRVARHIQPGMVIFLNGDLGTGKTTFVRGFLMALGHTGVVKSPTYTLVEPYQIKEYSIYHFDLYRLADPEELEYAGGRDYFDGDAISLIEWPEQAAGFLPPADLVINLEYGNAGVNSGRELMIQSGSDAGKKLMLQLIPD